MQRLFKSFKIIGASVLLAVVAGCGGGGGGGTSADPAPAPPISGPGGPDPTPLTSGLVPAAPALGQVLQADAASLRPLQEGATWRYRGLQQKASQSVRYETATVQTGVSGSTATERASNSGNDGAGDPSRIQIVAGEVSSDVTLDLTGKGQPGLLKVTELRSPVRVGDRVVIIDKRYTDTTLDVDNDKVTDSLDVAVYVQVVGAVTLDLPNLGTVQAVRVDTVVKARVRPSSTPTPGPVTESTLSNYYVAGVGVVRSSVALSPGDGSLATTDELLVSWDGISKGLGAMAAKGLVIPLTNAVFPGQSVYVDSTDVVVAGFENHALVITPSRGSFGDSLVNKVDRNGALLSARLLPGYTMQSGRPPLVHAGGVVFFDADSGGDSHRYRLTRLDREGALVGNVRDVTLDVTGSHIVNASAAVVPAIADDGTLWVFARRSFRDLSPQGVLKNLESEVVLRRYSLNGSLLAPEVVLPAAFNQSLEMNWKVSGDTAFMAARGGDLGNEIYVGSVDSRGISSFRTLASGLPGSNSFVMPFKAGAQQAVFWTSELGSGRLLGALGGVQIQTDLQAVRNGASWLDEQLPWMPPGLIVQKGTGIASSGTLTARLWPDDANDSLVDVVGWVDMAGTGPLARQAARSVRYPNSGPVRGVALFDDRALVFGASSGGLTSTVVWMPAR